VVFRSATEPFDTATPVGRMLVQMLGVFAEFERETIIDRVINGMERKAAKGLWTGGARPLGYTIDRTLDKLVTNPGEATTVRTIFDLYTTQRLGTKTIAGRLNDQGLRTRLGTPWSQHTVEMIIINRIYLGEKTFRDIVVPDAHEAIISPVQFDLAQQILGRRSAQIGQRAANPSGYTLTGLIRCPQCGRGYIGTTVTGRYKTYRYYTCWSRARYGNKAGCDIHRLNADDLDTAIGQSLLDFYTTGHDLITDAITRFQQAHLASSAAKREQLAMIKNELKETTAAVDRYLIAFERGTLDDDAPEIRARLTSLKNQSKALRARKAELELDRDQPPQPLAPAQLSAIRNRIRQVLAHEAHTTRKALFEALIHEITITADDTVRPVFKLPLVGYDEGPDPQGPALTECDANQMVRALPTMVGLPGIEPPLELRGLEPADAPVAEQPATVRTEQGPLDRLIMRLGTVVDRHVADPTADLAYEQSAQDAVMSDALGTPIRRLAVLLHRTDGPT
jgi:site-specific DNA recombinase